MTGIAGRLPPLNERGRERLDRALAGTRVGEEAPQARELLAKRDALLALAGEAA